jgi:hypothetical protein
LYKLVQELYIFEKQESIMKPFKHCLKKERRREKRTIM